MKQKTAYDLILEVINEIQSLSWTCKYCGKTVKAGDKFCNIDCNNKYYGEENGSN